ncbi:MAG: cation diffusion facilitator family transporter [Gammaproteobacteria bacterium]|nr:MAG: cation diffusion facilitator family transporter [Gammaproteobacteria bacterium]
MNQSPPLPKERRARLMKAASYASLATAVSLALLKAWAWLETDSVSLLGSLADSLLDLVASLLTFWAVRFSLEPADAEHRFGHGKSEGLAALVQAMIISGSGLYVCAEAIDRLVHPRAIASPELGIAVMVAATAATVLLVLFQLYVGRRTGSVAISADAMHYQTDIAVNIGVGLAIFLSAASGWRLLDPIVGLVVAAYILFGALGIIRSALEILLDREIPEEDRATMRRIALAHPEVYGMHDMKTRFGGSHYIVQFHLELMPHITLWRSHEILDEVEAAIRERYPDVEIIIHADPIGFPERQDFKR